MKSWALLTYLLELEFPEVLGWPIIKGVGDLHGPPKLQRDEGRRSCYQIRQYLDASHGGIGIFNGRGGMSYPIIFAPGVRALFQHPIVPTCRSRCTRRSKTATTNKWTDSTNVYCRMSHLSCNRWIRACLRKTAYSAAYGYSQRVNTAPSEGVGRRVWNGCCTQPNVGAFGEYSLCASTQRVARGRCLLGRHLLLQQSRHQLNQVARASAVVELLFDQKVPAVLTCTRRPRQTENVGAVRNACDGARLES